jgi:hypothetical protein
MRPTLLNSNEAGHSYGGRSYASLSPKVSSSTYSRPGMFSINSPKNESHKNLVYPSPIHQTASKYLNKTDKIEFALERKNSRASNDATPKNATLTSSISGFGSAPRLNPKVKMLEDKRPSVEKNRTATIDVLSGGSKYSSTPKVSESLNLREFMKKDRKRLEISTEYSTPKIETKISQTTKNKDTNESIPNDSIKKNVVSHYSFEFVSKFSKNGTPSHKAINLDDRSSATKLRGSSLLNRTNIAQEKNAIKAQHEVGTKLNNFFNNTGTYDVKKGEKSINASHMTNDGNITEDSISRNDSSKKAFSRTQQELRATLRGSSSDDSSKHEPPTQKVSLQSLVTKVNKGINIFNFLLKF